MGNMALLLLRITIACILVGIVISNKTDISRPGKQVGKPGNTDKRHQLMEDLTRNYDPRVLPVRNWSHSVQVKYTMSLNQIIELDEKSQVMRLVVWIRLYWRDEFLVWDPADYGGMEKVYLSMETIWRPDIVLYNSVDSERTAFEVFPPGMGGVTSDGNVSWFAPVIMESLCRIRVNNYPFDEQTCPLKFGSWSYDGFTLNFTSLSDKMDISKYVKSVEWKVSDTPCENNVQYYDCCPEPYPDVTCYIVMRRRPEFYLFNLVLPTVLLLIIGLLVFCLPPESGEKVSLAITIFLAIGVYMLIVMDNVPPNAEAIPLLELFIGGTIAMLALSTCMAVFVVNFHFRGSYSRPPRWVRSVCFGHLATVCCLRRQVDDLESEQMPPKGANNPDSANKEVKLMSLTSLENGKQSYKNSQITRTDDIKLQTTDFAAEDDVKQSLRAILFEMRQQSSRIRERYREQKQDSQGEMEWRIVAMTLDRIFFCLFLVLTLIMSFTIFGDVM